MIRVMVKETGVFVGEITEEDLQVLVNALEEESRTDDDYYLDRATVETLREAGASAGLLAVIETAFGGKDETEIRWARE